MKNFFITFLLAAFCSSAFAVPAYPEQIVFTQPGTEITVSIYLKGDERVHWAETVDGYSLLHDDNGSLVYACRNERGNMVPTNLLATDPENRSNEVNLFLKKTPKHLRFSKQQVEEMLAIWQQVEDAKTGPKAMSDVTGNKRFLVILFAFNDKPLTHNIFEFKQLFNQINYTAGSNVGSVHDYYYDVSGGLFSLRVDIAGPYTGVHNTSFYGNTNQGYQVFAHEAVDSAAKDVDFSLYDNDGDGYIDGLHIIFAGYGEEAGGGVNCIWSHKWNIFNPPTYNNTVIDVYSCSPECKGSSGGSITNIGVICHELGHVFGAPDYYDTDYEESGGEYPGLGQWDIMSSGSWNRNGISPAHHNPYTKIYIYRWATCDTIDATPRTVVLNPIETSNSDFHRINTSTPGDFFLIENRQKIKWDAATPGHGMLVYHIHPNANGANVSNYTHPQQIYILARTNLTDTFPTSNPVSYGNLNSSAATYPGEYPTRSSLTDNTVPWFRPWSKQPNNISFLNIAENSTTKKVFFTVGNASPDPLSASADGFDQQGISLYWTPYANYNTMIAINSESNTFGIPEGALNIGDTIEGGGIIIYKGSESNIVLNELQRNHTYYFKVFSCINNETYSDGINTQASTLDCDNYNWQYEDFETTSHNSLPDCWDGLWTVDSLMGQQALVCNGEGWQDVNSRPFTFDTIHNAVLHFKVHFGNLCDETACLKTEYRSNPTTQWQTIDSSTWVFGTATWRDIYLQLPDAGNYSRIRFTAYTSNGAGIAIDNIEIQKGSLIFASSDNNGNIIPRGYSILEENDTLKYTLTPLNSYHLKSLKIDNLSIDINSLIVQDNGSYIYNLTGFSGEHTLIATFEKNVSINIVETPTFSVYPNPANDFVNIHTTPGNIITLYDITGRRIDQQKAADKTLVFNLKQLPQGIYILRDEKTAVKVIKK